MSGDPLSNLKPFLLVASVLVGLGIGWAELNTRIESKAERAALDALAQRVEQEARAAASEARVQRFLLCRMPEIRPDSHCEGFR
jgi:hypothetical protein